MNSFTTISAGGSVTGSIVTFDDLLNHIRPLGRWQLQYVLLTGFLQIFLTMDVLISIFNEYKPDHACRIPEFDDRGYSIDLMKNLSSPPTTDNVVNTCLKYNIDYSTSDSVPANTTPTTNCSAWTYDLSQMTRTIVTEFDVVCDEAHWADDSKSAYMGGFFFGSLIGGVFADYFGRKPTYIVSTLLTLVFMVVTCVMPNVQGYAAMRFFTGIPGIMAVAASNFVQQQEITTARYRTILGGLFFIPWAIGYTSLPLFAYLLPDWRYLGILVSSPLILVIAYIWLIDESPRWLLAKGKVKEAEAVIRKAAKKNGVDLPDNFSMARMVQDVAEGKQESEKSMKTQLTWFSVLKEPKLCMRALNLYFNWFVQSMVYYGVVWQINNYSGSIFINNAVSGAIEFPAYLACVPLLRWGRRKSLAATLLVCGISLIAIAPIPSDQNTARLIFVYIARFSSTASFQIVYVISTELFPTVVRAQAVATSSMVARIGSILAPQISKIASVYSQTEYAHITAVLPTIIYGVFSVAAGILTFFLPETNQYGMPETLNEAKKMKACC